MSVVTKCNSSGLKNEISLFKHLKYEHFLAGISGGVTSTLALHPLDVIKIRFAVNDGRSGCTPHYKGIANAFSTIYREEGLRGLYRGVVPNVWGAGVSWGFYFLFYNSIKTWIQKGNANEPLGAPYHLLAATEAGIITLFIANPLWVVKTRLCIQHNGREDYKGLFDALVKIYRKDGPRGYYKGIVPGMFGVSHGAVQFMVYEEMKNRYNKFHNLPITTKLSTAHYLCFAATSKIAAVLTTYPYQVVRARLQNQYYTYNGSIDCIKQTWQYEGWRGFYKGMTANILRVTPAAVITFLSYENISHFLINEQGSKK